MQQPRIIVTGLDSFTTIMSIKNRGAVYGDKDVIIFSPELTQDHSVVNHTLHWFHKQTPELRQDKPTKEDPLKMESVIVKEAGRITAIEGDDKFKAIVVAYAQIHQIKLDVTPEPFTNDAAQAIITRHQSIDAALGPYRPTAAAAQQTQPQPPRS